MTTSVSVVHAPISMAPLASRMPASVLFDGSMVIEPPAWFPFCVKVAPVYLPSAKLPPETLPNEKVSVVGVPLPMISYGGSSLLGTLTSLGLLLSVSEQSG